MEKSLSACQVVDDGSYVPLSDLHLQNLKQTLDKSKSEVLVFSDVIKRQIYIWTGSEAPVRKKFISSRVANQLRFEIGAIANTQSVEQDDEPARFWEFVGLDKPTPTPDTPTPDPRTPTVPVAPSTPTTSDTPSTPTSSVASTDIRKKAVPVAKSRKKVPIKIQEAPMTTGVIKTAQTKIEGTKRMLFSEEQMDILAKKIGLEVETKIRQLLKDAGLLK
ncbi:MAG: hypothetical protein ACXAC7_02360 [Candidatus Hodarchaeales archaeon]